MQDGQQSAVKADAISTHDRWAARLEMGDAVKAFRGWRSRLYIIGLAAQSVRVSVGHWREGEMDPTEVLFVVFGFAITLPLAFAIVAGTFSVGLALYKLIERWLTRRARRLDMLRE